MYFLFLQTNNTSPKKSNSPVKIPAYRSVSPTRQLERPTSPFKPHPLQFVSPQKAQEPPVKPPRTYIDMEEEGEDGDDVDNDFTFKSEIGININQDTPNAVATETGNQKQEEKVETRTDTASRRSILEKRNLFESSSPPSPQQDPAMLPLSQRKALFERIKSVPKPIAR